MSELTMGSSVYTRTLASLPLVAAALNASLTSSARYVTGQDPGEVRDGAVLDRHPERRTRRGGPSCW